MASYKLDCYIVDAFTDVPFKGNPAGVCIVEKMPLESLMLSIANELGLSETAFVALDMDKGVHYIRFFSPKMEIPLCGHATLASARIVFDRYPDKSKICFKNINGLNLNIESDGDSIQMEFPIYETSPAQAPKPLLQALGIQEILYCAHNEETNILMLEISDCKLLRNLNPDFESLYRSHDSINGVLVTAISEKPNFDFESRYFWPWSGTNEDPATGATHTFLAKYWGDKLGKTKMRSFQCSERMGEMEVELIGDDSMLIRSQGCVVFSGSLII